MTVKVGSMHGFLTVKINDDEPEVKTTSPAVPVTVTVYFLLEVPLRFRSAL